jgi:hypothetical protein
LATGVVGALFATAHMHSGPAVHQHESRA